MRTRIPATGATIAPRPVEGAWGRFAGVTDPDQGRAKMVSSAPRAPVTPTSPICPSVRGPRPWLVMTLAAVILLAASPVRAAPSAAAKPDTSAAPADLEEALGAGDLEGARALAVAARKADPTPSRWAEEARIQESIGDLPAAIKAWKGYLKALPPGDAEGRRETGEEKLQELRERARGANPDEPESTHRGELDKARADRLAALRPKPPPPKPVVKPPPPKEKIIKKWYFWVTVAAIAASAAAITGIAVKAAREEQADDLDPRGGPLLPPPGGLGLRF